MAYEQELKFFAEKEAKRDQRVIAAQVGDVELRRWFPITRDDLLQLGAAFLYRFTSAKNTDAVTADTPRYYVDDPEMDGKTYPGRYRSVSVQEGRQVVNPEQQGIIQVLRKGYLETLVTDGAVDWSEARVLQRQDQQQDGNLPQTAVNDVERYLRVAFRNVSPRSVNGIASSIADLKTFDDVVINGESVSGTYHNLIVSAKIEPEDGSGTIEVFIGDPEFQITAFQDVGGPRAADVVYLYGVAKDLVQGVLDGWKALAIPGSGATVSYNKDSSLVDLIFRKRTGSHYDKGSVATQWNCRYKTMSNFYFGLTAAELDVILATIAQPAAGVSIDVNIQYNATENLWDLTINTRTRSSQTVSPYTSSESYADATVSQELLGTTNEFVLPLDTKAVGIIQRRTIEKNEDCTFNIRLDKTTVLDQTADSYIESAASKETRHAHTQATAALGDPGTPAAGTYTEFLNTPTEAGKFRTEERTTDVKNQTASSYGRNAAANEDTAIQTQGSALADPGTQAAGTMVVVNNSPTEAGKFRTEQRTTVVINQQAVSGADSAASSSVRTLDTQNASVPSTTREAGKTTRVDATPTEAGNYRTVVEVETPKDQTATGGEANAARTVSRTTHTQSDSNPAVTPVAGVQVRVDATPTEFGKYRTTVETDTPKDQTATSGEANAARTVSRTTHTQSDSNPAVTPVAGVQVRVDATPTEFGKYRTMAETDTPTNQTATSFVKTSAYVEQTDTATQANAAITDPGVVELQVKRIDNVPTEYGKYRTVTEIRTFVDQSATSYSKDKFQNSATETHTQAAVALGEPTFVDGTVVGRQSSPTEVGGYRTESVDRVVIKQEWNSSFTDRYGTTYVWRGRNVTRAEYNTALAAAALTSATNNEAVLTLNESGLYDYSIAKVPYELAAAYSNWWGTMGTVSSDVIERDRRPDPYDPSGYKFRDITIHIHEYTGVDNTEAWNVFKSGAVSGTGSTGDEDSVRPKILGYYVGQVVYRSVWIHRTYTADWTSGDDDVSA